MVAFGIFLLSVAVIFVVSLYIYNVRTEAKARARRASMSRHPAGRGR